MCFFMGWLRGVYGTQKGSKDEIFRGGGRGEGLFWVGERLWTGTWGFGDQLGGRRWGAIGFGLAFIGLGGPMFIDRAEGMADDGLRGFAVIEHGDDLDGILYNRFTQGTKGRGQIHGFGGFQGLSNSQGLTIEGVGFLEFVEEFWTGDRDEFWGELLSGDQSEAIFGFGPLSIVGGGQESETIWEDDSEELGGALSGRIFVMREPGISIEAVEEGAPGVIGADIGGSFIWGFGSGEA